MEPRLARTVSGDALDEWRELNARWFQFSTFSPILRLHGTDRPRELWNIGEETTPVYQTMLKFDKLRYALFPYIYSIAAEVTRHDSTMMRPLVMDFRNDANARNVTDQYMFGPAFLVNPVTEYKARTRTLYLPAQTAWYDFWTGRRSEGGQTVTVDAPYDRLPLFVRAGAIVPVGPDQQYIGEKTRAAITVYVYSGADGSFSLYEDDGRTYGYERDEFSVVPLSWNEGGRTLTIGDAAQSSLHDTGVQRRARVAVSRAGLRRRDRAGEGRQVPWQGRSRDVLEELREGQRVGPPGARIAANRRPARAPSARYECMRSRLVFVQSPDA